VEDKDKWLENMKDDFLKRKCESDPSNPANALSRKKKNSASNRTQLKSKRVPAADVRCHPESDIAKYQDLERQSDDEFCPIPSLKAHGRIQPDIECSAATSRLKQSKTKVITRRCEDRSWSQTSAKYTDVDVISARIMW
jgi:hypothetical protein